MRKRYKIKKQISKLNNNDNKNDLNTNKLMIINNEDNEKDSLNNIRQRNTISNLSNKPALYKNFRLNKKLGLNDIGITTTARIDDQNISKNNEIIEINQDKNNTKIYKRKSFIHENGIIVNRPTKIRNKLFINKTEMILKTNQNIQTKKIIKDDSIQDSENKNTIENITPISINKNNSFMRNTTNNANIKKIEVNLIKNRIKSKNNLIRIEKYPENKSPYINTDRNNNENKTDIINRRESNDFLSFVKKYKINSTDKNIKSKNINIEIDNINSKERLTYNNITNKYLKIDTNTDSRNIKFDKSPLKLLVHKAFKNTNLSEIFTKMYDSYLTQRTKSKNKDNDVKDSNKYLTLEKKSNANNDSSINEKNSDINQNHIAKILKEYGSEKIKKKHIRLIKLKPKEELNAHINNDGIHIEDDENNKQLKMGNKIVNNNTYNTTFNIYKINNIISKKPSNSYRKNNINKLLSRKLNDSNNEKDKEHYNLTIENDKFITSFKETYDKYKKKTIENFNKINMEILYSLISKIKEIVNKINTYEHCFHECNDFILFFFENEIYESFVNSFKSKNNKKMIINIIKVEILCFFLYYDSSFYKNYIQAGILFKTIFNLLNKNFLIMISYIMNNFIKISSYNIFKRSLFIDLSNYIKKELNPFISTQEIHNENFVINLIKQNYAQINNYYQMIINNLDNYNISKSHGHKDMKNKDIYKFPQSLSLDSNKSNTIIKSTIISNFFFDAFKSLNSYNISDLKIFYYSYLIKEFMDKKRNNILKRKVINYQKYKNGYFRLLSNNTRLNKSIKNYLPPIKSTHKYSLIINLDALIFVQNKFDKLNSIQLRPGLIQFLKEMKQFYELILYSENNFDYISSILKNFEDDENKYFENILSNYKININPDGSIDNLDLLGRNINNIIFIDDIKNTSKFNNNSIIYLKSFYGNEKYNKNLMYNLIDILKKIRLDAEEYEDIKTVLEKYKYFIFTKITNILFL